MHGRIKVRTTEEQRILKEKEQQKKLNAYRTGMKTILSTRKSDSYDADSFSLSAKLLLMNPDIYTLWNYRKEVIQLEIKNSNLTNQQIIINDNATDEKEVEDVNKDGEKQRSERENLIKFLDSEIDLTENCLISNPKSYSSWHHRYWVLERHPEPNWKKEFNLCTTYLTADDRNFHCWDYRRLILNKIGMSLEDEVKFSTERININFSNYSSWHYRSTLRKLDAEALESEINLILNAVFTDPADSSAWFYLRWILNNPEMKETHRKKLTQNLDQLLELEPDSKWCLIAKSWVKSYDKQDDEKDEELVEIYKKLLILDPLRKGYYCDKLKVAEGILK